MLRPPGSDGINFGILPAFESPAHGIRKPAQRYTVWLLDLRVRRNHVTGVMSRHLASLLLIMLVAWMAGMMVHASQLQRPPPIAEAQQKIG